MKKLLYSLLLLLLVGGGAYGLLWQARYSQVAESVTRLIAPAQHQYADRPLLTIAVFCLAHLLASSLSLPGCCTILNTIAGAVFGFWPACAILYPITLLSGALGYALGTRLRGTKLAQSYEESISIWARWLSRHDFLLYVGLRLSPLLPFGLLNIVMGLVRVPFSLYMSTTAVGIFFDITILANLGAGVSAAASTQSEKSLALSFFALLALFFLLRIALARVYDQKAGAR